MTTTNPRLMKPPELRKKLGGVSLIWLWRHAHELPKPITIAGRRFWSEAEIDEFIGQQLAARTVESAEAGESAEAPQ